MHKTKLEMCFKNTPLGHQRYHQNKYQSNIVFLTFLLQRTNSWMPLEFLLVTITYLSISNWVTFCNEYLEFIFLGECIWNPLTLLHSIVPSVWDASHDLVPFGPFKKCEKRRLRCVTFSKVPSFSLHLY